MLGVSDTSPLNYLVLIKTEEVLPALYTAVLIPSQVLEELQRPKTPDHVRLWASQLPSWVHVQEGDVSRFPTLNYGEAAGLALAIDTHAEAMLVDDGEARFMPRAVGVVPIGTVAILGEAHRATLLDFDTTIFFCRMA